MKMYFDRSFDFDVTDDEIPLKQTLVELQKLLNAYPAHSLEWHSAQRFYIIGVNAEGPGGGWPNITVYCSENEAPKVKAWLLEHIISWTDELGETHDEHC